VVVSASEKFQAEESIGDCRALSVLSDRRDMRYDASYETSGAEAFGNLPSSPAYLAPAFLKAMPSSMNLRC
jgi:hypothetical protein